jgi:hypothetical protein
MKKKYLGSSHPVGRKKIKKNKSNKNKNITPEDLSNSKMKELLSKAAVAAIQQNKDAGISTVAFENDKLIQILPNGTKRVIKKLRSSRRVLKGKYSLGSK